MKKVAIFVRAKSMYVNSIANGRASIAAPPSMTRPRVVPMTAREFNCT
jgi:hypothetical protein